MVGHWTDTPLGAFADAMVETAAGHRVLLAPRQEVADFIEATYSFDEVRLEPFAVTVDGDRWPVRSPSLELDLVVGGGRRSVRPCAWSRAGWPSRRPGARSPTRSPGC